ncbi:TetR family transcriptional regulator [Nakamurella lactea]|uniref:TetR family transcriptional regulator n=1 Tax=Nakamurella lactea TaxID=459515 RepID=UPI00137891C7|nr:TetR family transcriptional regulator [Nakamurella lactea]
MRSAEDDLTARARIRDAATMLIARQGFASTTVRAVATAAGVSPALVLHHFGSKAGLRQACDDAVWDEFHAVITSTADDVSAGELLRQFSIRTNHSPAAIYVTRALLDGGEFAHRVFDGMVADVEGYMANAVRSGIVRPARDEHTRALMLTSYSLGSMLLGRYIVGEDVDPIEIPDRLIDLFTDEGLDVYTDGLFTDSRIRDALRTATAAEKAKGPAARSAANATQSTNHPKGMS